MGNSKILLSNGTTLIDLTSDTVTAPRLLSPYKAHGANGESITGSMINRGSVYVILDNNTKVYTVPKGYHDGTGIVTLDPQMYFTKQNSSTYKPGSRKTISNLSIDIGFQPKVFFMRASTTTASSASQYEVIFGFCLKMPWDSEKYGCTFNYTPNKGGNSYGGQGPRIASNGVIGTGTSAYLVNGTYTWNAWG